MLFEPRGARGARGKEEEECFLCVPHVPEGAERAGGYILFEPRGARGEEGGGMFSLCAPCARGSGASGWLYSF
jgi:hypothetical protein